MSENSDWGTLIDLINEYIDLLHVELAGRWDNWNIDLVNRERYEVIGGLLARQVTLATQLALAPSTWNGHIAPLVLRTMIDTHITLAWILEDLSIRAQQYIEYGLGQEKLHMEHRKTQLTEDGINADEDLWIKATEAWIDSQQYTFLTKVTIGSWSGKSTREMASEVNLLGLYNYAYVPFSGATHSMWNHVDRYNLLPCPNPLHGYHKVPFNPSTVGSDPDYLYRAAKFADKSFRLFDTKTGMTAHSPSALKTLSQRLQEFNQEPSEGTTSGTKT